ncbi:hypothetical protein QEN19_002148 [Hanseniaspora menglaensis]
MSNSPEFKSNLPLAKLTTYINNKQQVKIEMSDSQKFKSFYIKGFLVGIDEYMNLIIKDTYKVSKKPVITEESLGKMLLKGDNILLITEI